MKLEFDTNNPSEIAAVHAMSQALMGITPVPTSTVAPAKPASPPKAAATPAPTPAASPAPSAAAPSPAPAPAPAPAATPAPAGDAPTDLAGLAAMFQKFVAANGPAKAKALLTETGFSKVADIPQDQYATFAAKLAV